MNLTFSLDNLIYIIVTICVVTWKLSEIRRELEKTLNKLDDRLIVLSNKVDYNLQTSLNETKHLDNKIINIKNYVSGKIKDLQYQFNEVVNYLEKINPEHKFIIRSRIINKDTLDNKEG